MDIQDLVRKVRQSPTPGEFIDNLPNTAKTEEFWSGLKWTNKMEVVIRKPKKYWMVRDYLNVVKGGHPELVTVDDILHLFKLADAGDFDYEFWDKLDIKWTPEIVSNLIVSTDNPICPIVEYLIKAVDGDITTEAVDKIYEACKFRIYHDWYLDIKKIENKDFRRFIILEFNSTIEPLEKLYKHMTIPQDDIDIIVRRYSRDKIVSFMKKNIDKLNIEQQVYCVKQDYLCYNDFTKPCDEIIKVCVERTPHIICEFQNPTKQQIKIAIYRWYKPLYQLLNNLKANMQWAREYYITEFNFGLDYMRKSDFMSKLQPPATETEWISAIKRYPSAIEKCDIATDTMWEIAFQQIIKSPDKYIDSRTLAEVSSFEYYGLGDDDETYYMYYKDCKIPPSDELLMQTFEEQPLLWHWLPEKLKSYNAFVKYVNYVAEKAKSEDDCYKYIEIEANLLAKILPSSAGMSIKRCIN